MATKPLSQPAVAPTQDQSRQRVQVDVSPAVSSLLDHVCEVTGGTRSSVVLQALLDALPALVERADSLKKRHREISQPVGKR